MKKNVIKIDGTKQLKSLEEVAKNFDDWKKKTFTKEELQAIVDENKKNIEKLLNDYEAIFKASEPRIQKEGLWKPINHHEFIVWCVENVPGFSDLKINEVNFKRKWIVEFSNYQQSIIEKEGIEPINNEWQPLEPPTTKPTAKAKPKEQPSVPQFALMLYALQEKENGNGFTTTSNLKELQSQIDKLNEFTFTQSIEYLKNTLCNEVRKGILTDYQYTKTIEFLKKANNLNKYGEAIRALENDLESRKTEREAEKTTE